MGTWSPENEIHRLEDAVSSGNRSFAAAYMSVRALHAMIVEYPETISRRTTDALKTVLNDPGFISQTQSLAFYREVSGALGSILANARHRGVFESGFSILKTVTTLFAGVQQRSAAEALGALPLHIRGLAPGGRIPGKVPMVLFSDICETKSLLNDNPKFLGRSIIWDMKEKNRVFVIKQATSETALAGLYKEARWMEHLNREEYDLGRKFHIPRPCRFKNSFVFRPARLPADVKRLINGSAQYGAMAYIAHKNYFSYPNTLEKDEQLDGNTFAAVITGNAQALGEMTRMGIIHTAPIPLFHNRTQQRRRADDGLYEWPRGGRLDRWLHSSQYPNFSISGLRDFEHLTPFTGPDRLLYRHIGTHLMSLLLVTGSYFRNKAPNRMGLDECGNPADTRDLFDEDFFRNLIADTFKAYYTGFVGQAFEGDIPADLSRLSKRLVEEMGCDRHMEEVLRVSDQQAMSDKGFEDFLLQRGFSRKKTTDIHKGDADITIRSGPHLGDFNGRISVPELITFLAGASAFCIADKYYVDRLLSLS
jgi:hypothetical protein